MAIPETNRTLVAEAFGRLSAEDRAFVRRAYYYGWTTAQIGADLGVAEGTVKSHVKAIFAKMNVVSRTEAVVEATRRGLIRL